MVTLLLLNILLGIVLAAYDVVHDGVLDLPEGDHNLFYDTTQVIETIAARTRKLILPSKSLSDPGVHPEPRAELCADVAQSTKRVFQDKPLHSSVSDKEEQLIAHADNADQKHESFPIDHLLAQQKTSYEKYMQNGNIVARVDDIHRLELMLEDSANQIRDLRLAYQQNDDLLRKIIQELHEVRREGSSR